MTRRSFSIGLAAFVFMPPASNEIPRSASKATISVTVELGPENGKPLGTIFQLRRASSVSAIAAAVGVPQFYNHYVRNNTRLLHAHGRKADESAFTVTELGTPRNDYPRYHVFVFDGVLIDGTNREYFNEGSGAWQALSNPWNGSTFSAGEQINYAQRIEGKVFISTDHGIFYDGVRIVSYAGASYRSSNGTSLFYNGRLFTNWDDGVLRTYAWTPGGSVGSPISSYNLISGHFLRAFGIVGGIVYAVSGYGRLLRYDWAGNSWSYVTQAESVAEFYSLMAVRGTLRLGDYPNGDQWIINSSDALERLPNYPPEEAGASPNLREIQAMTMYGGDQILPTWPWGVVHRQHMATGDWHYQRIYTAPPVDASQAPYYTTLGNNDWGQRIPSIGLYRDGVFVSAAPKTGDLLHANYASIPNRSEYGKVWLLKRPHAFSAELDWKAGQTTFTFEISAAGISLKQDGVSLGSVSGFAPSQFEGSDAITVELGDGIYGPFGGTIIGSQIAVEF